jgi:hypothetical protein
MLENIPFILTYASIAQALPGDTQLQLLHTQKPNQYTRKLLAPNMSYGAIKNPRPWHMYLPHDMLEHAVKWYHHVLSHVGRVRLTATMSLTFYNPQIHKVVEASITKMSSKDMVLQPLGIAMEPCCC